MRLPRNPFRSTKVESLESHDLFLKLFQPIALGALGPNPWDSVMRIKSAQGGGKTSLLRVLSPECLLRVSEGTSTHLAEIAEQLKALGAIGDGRPSVLGIYVPLGSTPYATIARLRLGSQDPLHLLYALLDARVVLTAINGVQVLRGLDSESDLSRITFDWPDGSPNPLYEHASARDLVSWARGAEREIWRAIDRGKASLVTDLGHARPYSFEALSPSAILVDGEPICERVVVMVDDAHKLHGSHRKTLLEHVITSRLNVSFWIAERMHAMEPYELLALDTSSTEREDDPVVLSAWWQKHNKAGTSRFYADIAKRRLEESRVEELFEHLTPSVIEDRPEVQRIQRTAEAMRARLEDMKGEDVRFSEIETARKPNQSAFDYLVDLKAVEMYIASVKSKTQDSFEFEGSVPAPTSTQLSDLRSAAEYQVCIMNDLPLYYGANTIYEIASWNVDQFLSLAAGVYDQFDAQRVQGTGVKVLPRAQDKLIREIAAAYFVGLPKRMPNGEKMQRFLQAFARYAVAESQAPTKKYGPGVTGFGMTSKDHDRLRNCSETNDAHLMEFADLISSAVAHNVVFMKANAKQGKAGETVTVFYLNRLLCVYLNLPIGLGGWWKRKVDHFATLTKTERPQPAQGEEASLF